MSYIPDGPEKERLRAEFIKAMDEENEAFCNFLDAELDGGAKSQSVIQQAKERMMDANRRKMAIYDDIVALRIG